MSLEFKRKKSHNAKWSKKYPRTKINNRGGNRKAIIAAGWYKYNWIDAHYSLFSDKHIMRFLKSNVGRLIDKVFSDFLKRCNTKIRKSYSLKKEFYSNIDKKEDIGCRGGFYISNGILNYKESCSKEEYRKQMIQDYYKPLQDCIEYNRLHIPNDKSLRRLCEEATNTKTPQLLGKLYTRIKYTNQLKRVYIIDSCYPSFLYEPCKILTKNDYNFADGVYILSNLVYFAPDWHYSRYKLVTKIKREKFKE